MKNNRLVIPEKIKRQIALKSNQKDRDASFQFRAKSCPNVEQIELHHLVSGAGLIPGTA